MENTIVSDRSLRVSDFEVPQQVFRLEKAILSDPRLVDDTINQITTALEDFVCWDDIDRIGLAMREALINAIVHGNHCDRKTTVRISVAVNEDCDLAVSVKDSGAGFDLTRVSNPTIAENLLVKHGRGIFLMRQLMDEVEFSFDQGTEVRMRRRQQWFE